MERELLGDEALWASDVVANCNMNRLRQLAGPNSYARELGFNPLDRPITGWLDLCCGSGRALVEAERHLRAGPAASAEATAEATALAPAGAEVAAGVTLVGVDLVDAFDRTCVSTVEFVCTPVDRFQPRQAFDLITCVHGLHYVGDKLGLLARAAGWLTPAGRLVADLDPASVRIDGEASPRKVVDRLRKAGFDYDTRRRQVRSAALTRVTFDLTYLGADDRTGPNYTGQPAVTSYYRSS
jgi:SAM-dependent methyltransferase